MNDSMNVAGKPVNEPTAQVPRNRSKFDMNYHLYNSERFGEYNVPFVMDCVEGDKVNLRSGGSVQSYTLKAPLMQSIFKKKDFYTVPMMAILPFNWDKFYTNPVIGDDVPDEVGTGVTGFWSLVAKASTYLLGRVLVLINNTSSTPAQIITGMIRTLVFMEYFYSNGSLIRSLGCSGSRYFHYNHVGSGFNYSYSFDKWFDDILGVFTSICPYVGFVDGDGFTKYAVFQPTVQGLDKDYAVVNVHDFLQYFRDDLNCGVTVVPSSVTQSSLSSNLAPYLDFADTTRVKVIDDVAVNYNLNRLFAYQLVCAHFYSNDHVDYIYSAELYRQLIRYCIVTAGYSTLSFSYNGISYAFDFLSGHHFFDMLKALDGNSTVADGFLNLTGAANLAFRGYFSNILSYRRSLRFVDYFTGARTRPLAVGDVNVDVQTGSPNYVNVIDVSQNIQRQRFFNAVNRFGRKIEEYAKGLTGVSMAPDYHNPLYLAHTSDLIYGQETENTGADQLTKSQTVTSRLASNGNRYQFEFSIDRPSVVIGISYYDIPRCYSYNCERPLLHMNRFDMFNPFMQFIGDQPVYFAELGVRRSINYNGNFGYQLRHMEYKQRYSQLAGAFVENLPGFAFPNDDDARGNTGVQSSDYIHSLNGELDKFYVSLTGYSLGSYFHFIVDNDNVCEASRQMAYAPSIL